MGAAHQNGKLRTLSQSFLRHPDSREPPCAGVEAASDGQLGETRVLGCDFRNGSCVDGALRSSTFWRGDDCGRVQSCVWPVDAAILHDCWP